MMTSRQVSKPHSRGDEGVSAPDLALCEGFRVESPDGYLGVVETFRYAPSARFDQPSEVAVYAGRSKDMLLIFPLSEVESIDLAERRVVLRSSPTIVATERLSV